MGKHKRGFMVENNMQIQSIKPLTLNQTKAFKSNKNLVLHGSAGTGKSFISLYLGFQGIIEENYNRILIIRSAVPTRDIGFLPGSEAEKARVYEVPYQSMCIELFNRGDAYEILKQKHVVNFMTTSFIRGITIKNTVIIVDEIQNMTFHELDSIITRVGNNCRIMFCGDFYQSDLSTNGLKEFLQILKTMECFDFIEFTVEDIVRSGFVKEYLTAKNESRPIK